MRTLKMWVMGLTLFLGAQSALACCGEDPRCMCPLSDCARDLNNGEDDPNDPFLPIVSCLARCVDIICLWPCCWPCLVPMSLCCPTCGVAKQKVGEKKEGVRAEPRRMMGRPQERRENEKKDLNQEKEENTT